jgi:hypothetical protein
MRTSLAEVARMRAQAPMSDVGVRRLCAGVRGCSFGGGDVSVH